MNNWKTFSYLFPENSHHMVEKICFDKRFELVVKYNRCSKLGDFRHDHYDQSAMITVNGDMNTYHFLITFIHELAHLVVWNEYGRKARSHGKEWKNTYAQMLAPFVTKEIFPESLILPLYNHLKKPKASTYADANLLEALRYFNHDNDQMLLLKELEENKAFKLENGKAFVKGKIRRSRVMCKELNGKSHYLIHAHAEVFPL